MEEEIKEKGSKWPFICLIIVLPVCVTGLIIWAVVAGHKAQEQAAQQDSNYLYTSELAPRETATIVIQCDEERYQNSFNDFVANGLKEEKADTLGVTGGARWFAAPKDIELPEWLKPAKRVTIEFLKRHSPGKIILIAHSRCIISDVVAAWKDEALTAEEKKVQEIKQLKESGRLIGSWFPDSRIEMYYAEEIGNNKLGFTEIQDKESEEKE